MELCELLRSKIRYMMAVFEKDYVFLYNYYVQRFKDLFKDHKLHYITIK